MIWIIEKQKLFGIMRKHVPAKIARVVIGEEKLFADLEDGRTISVPLN